MNFVASLLWSKNISRSIASTQLRSHRATGLGDALSSVPCPVDVDGAWKFGRRAQLCFGNSACEAAKHKPLLLYHSHSRCFHPPPRWFLVGLGFVVYVVLWEKRALGGQPTTYVARRLWELEYTVRKSQPKWSLLPQKCDYKTVWKKYEQSIRCHICFMKNKL